jgi:hypothetical protein
VNVPPVGVVVEPRLGDRQLEECSETILRSASVSGSTPASVTTSTGGVPEDHEGPAEPYPLRGTLVALQSSTRCLGTPLLVVGEREDAFDVAGATAKTIGELTRGDALLAPAQQPTLDRPEPTWCLWSAAARQLREHEHPLDVILAALEPTTDLGGQDAVRRELADPTFERSEISEGVHG